MKIIVPGASGFVGRNFILQTPSDWDVYAIYNNSQDFPAFIKDHELEHVRAISCDFTNEEQLNDLSKIIGSHCEACVYFLANGNPALSTQDPILDLSQNTLALLGFLKTFTINRFIYFSSGAVYDKLSGPVTPQSAVDPHLPYAISKLASEQYIKFFAARETIKEYIILRFFGCFGPYEPDRKIYTKLVKNFCIDQKNEFTVTGDGQNLIDAMYVDDTIAGIFKVLDSPHKNKVVDFCSARPLTIDNLVKLAASVFDRTNVNVVHQGAVPEYIDFQASPEEMQNLFDFKPQISLEEGFKKLAKHLKS